MSRFTSYGSECLFRSHRVFIASLLTIFSFGSLEAKKSSINFFDSNSTFKLADGAGLKLNKPLKNVGGNMDGVEEANITGDAEFVGRDATFKSKSKTLKISGDYRPQKVSTQLEFEHKGPRDDNKKKNKDKKKDSKKDKRDNKKDKKKKDEDPQEVHEHEHYHEHFHYHYPPYPTPPVYPSYPYPPAYPPSPSGYPQYPSYPPGQGGPQGGGSGGGMNGGGMSGNSSQGQWHGPHSEYGAHWHYDGESKEPRYNPKQDAEIKLDGGSDLNTGIGGDVAGVYIDCESGLICGMSQFTKPITLSCENSAVNIAIAATLNQNIELNGGSINLIEDLHLGDDTEFTGSGTVRLNGRRLHFGGRDFTYTGTIFWDAAGDIVLNSRTDLTSTWTFGGESNLNGNGNILDLSGGGNLWINSGATLHLTDVKVKGLHTGNFVFVDETAELELTSTCLEFDNDYSLTTGGIYVEGTTRFLIRNHAITFSQEATLSVDGETLWYDRLGYTTGGITPSEDNTFNLVFLNDGRLCEVSDHDLVVTTSNAVVALDAASTKHRSFLDSIDHGPHNYIYDSNATLSYDMWLSSNHEIQFTANSIISGGGHTIEFARGSSTELTIDAGVTVTFQNVVLRNFEDSVLSLGASSGIFFGDDCIVELGNDMDLSMGLTFIGSGTLNGRGCSIALNDPFEICSLSGASMEFKDLTLTGVQGQRLRCQDNTSTFNFDNVTLKLDDDFRFVSGQMSVTNDFKIHGPHTFSYETKMGTTIQSHSSMVFENNSTFSYSPGGGYNSLIAMTDDTSSLALNGCTFKTTETGVALTKGTFKIDGKSYMTAAGSTRSEAIIFGNGTEADDLEIDMMPGSTLEIISGMILYKNAGG
ncbi:hypothetical protein HOD08_00805 [bacterium]|nr:hypothetical protein [bacterium]